MDFVALSILLVALRVGSRAVTAISALALALAMSTGPSPPDARQASAEPAAVVATAAD